MYKQSKVHSATIDKNLSQTKDTTPAVFIDIFFIKDIDFIEIIKMDIECAEIFAFQGMQEMLSKKQVHLFMEVHGAYVEPCYRGGMNIMREMLESNNYAIYSCDGCACTQSALTGRVYINPKANLV